MELPLTVAQGLMSLPTVPLIEDLPLAHVVAFARDRPGLAADQDAAGNVVVRYQGERADPSRPLVMVAHLDHPGFVVDSVADRLAYLTFRGGLGLDHARPGSPLDFFRRGHPDPVAHGELVSATGCDGRLSTGQARVLEGDVSLASFAMWGFPGFEVGDGHIHGRVCDDLLGAAAVLSVLDEVARREPTTAVWGLFTRAEEIGFLGTLEAIRLQTLPPAASVLSIECSQALPGAPQGAGVIVRVGDRRSIFDPALTHALGTAAGHLSGTDPSLRWQRKLMDGGTCEASAFCANGYRASGLALPLGNYHNALDQPPGRTMEGAAGVGPEHVAVDDYLAAVRLLVGLACAPALLDGPIPTQTPDWLVEPMARARAELG
ncbi:MAG: hypothetical protein ACR2G7_04035 [Acidimicrobiales bacterium]